MPTLLIVDDDTKMRELLYDWCSRRSFSVLTANSGTQALETLKTQRPDIILLDMAMPGLTGLEAAKRIRIIDDSVPILLMRGAGDAEPPPQLLKRLGISDVVRKEQSGELFLKSLEASLDRLESSPRKIEESTGVAMPGTLLLVDDEPAILQLLKSFFELRGMRVMTAGSGEEALKALPKKPSAILLDMTMPGMDGLMTLKKIKSKQPKVPIIMVSGMGDEATVQEALDAGAYDYVTKPFNLQYLETVVLTKILLGLEK